MITFAFFTLLTLAVTAALLAQEFTFTDERPH